jgi:hypothetical protein
MVLLKGYVFGDRFMAPAFRSAIIYHLAEHLLSPYQKAGTIFAYVELVKYTYGNVPAGSVVLQLLADKFCDY